MTAEIVELARVSDQIPENHRDAKRVIGQVFVEVLKSWNVRMPEGVDMDRATSAILARLTHEEPPLFVTSFETVILDAVGTHEGKTTYVIREET